MNDPNLAIDLSKVRSLYPITAETAYFYNGNINPCAAPVRRAMEEFLDVWSTQGDGAWDYGWSAFEEAKRLYANLVSTRPETLCSITNTTTGINIAAKIINPSPGSNVVVDELSHMSNVYPWLQMRQNSVETRVARAENGEIAIGELARLVDDQTAAINICHVSMANGFRYDLGVVLELAQKHGAALVVDAAQSVGAVPIDLRETPVDFLAAPTFKWLMGPLGAGFLHVREDWIERSDPPFVGWMSVVNPLDNDLREMQLHDSALRFERGVLNMIGFVGARAGLELLFSVGPQAIAARTARLASSVYEGLQAFGDDDLTVWTPRNPNARAGIIAFDLPGRQALHQHLGDRGIYVGDFLEHIRVDTAFYNSEEEVDRLLAEIGEFVDHKR